MPEPYYAVFSGRPIDLFTNEAEAIASARDVSQQMPGETIHVALVTVEVVTSTVVTRLMPEEVPAVEAQAVAVEPAPMPPIQRIYDATGEEWGSTMDPKSWLAEYRQILGESTDKAAAARHNLPMLELLAARLGGKFAEELERARALGPVKVEMKEAA